MQTQESLSIAMLEALAANMEEGEQERRTKLLRLVGAYARIVAVREPGTFKPRATEYADEDGHFDSSYPPKQEYKARTGPRSIKIVAHDTEDQATSGGGFYHDYKTVTVDPGLYVGTKGQLYGCDQSGTGHFGQFAAYPGACRVENTLRWSKLAAIDVPLDRIEAAEAKLRALAFPLIAAAKAALASN